MRKLQRFLALLVAAVVLAVALGTLVPRPLWPAAAADEGTRRILVLKNLIHTDIAIPVDDETRRRFRFLTDAGLPRAHLKCAISSSAGVGGPFTWKRRHGRK